MSNVTKVKDLLAEVSGSPKTQKETEWFLAFYQTDAHHELNRREQTEMVQDWIANPPTYESLAGELLETLAEEQKLTENEQYVVAGIADFYDK